MNNATPYFKLARAEETAGRSASALLFYLSSFCAGFNSGQLQYPYQATAKIRTLQLRLGLSDGELLQLIHSYGPLTDQECQALLLFAIRGWLSGIHAVLSGKFKLCGGNYEAL